MIHIVLYREGNRLTGFSAKGHSGYAEAGSDIICAAVSILGCTCVNSLESVCGVVPRIRDNKEGSLVFDLPELSGEQSHDTGILMDALKQGLSDLAEQYPEFVHLSIQERRK